MNAAGRLGLYAAGVVVAFAAAFAAAAAVVPDQVTADWNEGETMDDHSTHDDASAAPAGVSLSAGGYELSPVTAPNTTGEAGELAFQILGDGDPLTAYARTHEKDLHLIVVRSDGSQFRHVHPTLDETTGVWSTPWEWDEAGTYRVFTDFTPDVADSPGNLTLARTIDVSGSFTAVPAAGVKASDTVDGFDIALEGELVAGSASDLTLSISRDGQPVTALEPYLGAFGHLVALRDGDLAYLHAHPEGDEPRAGETGGPDISFAVHAPTAGRYLLYLDFQVDGHVHTAQFVLDAHR